MHYMFKEWYLLKVWSKSQNYLKSLKNFLLFLQNDKFLNFFDYDIPKTGQIYKKNVLLFAECEQFYK